MEEVTFVKMVMAILLKRPKRVWPSEAGYGKKRQWGGSNGITTVEGQSKETSVFR